MAADTVPDLGPKDVIGANGDYMLQTRDMFNLLKYIWTGVLLAQTPQEYQDRTKVTKEHYNKYKTLLDPLIEEYKDIHSHCKKFKDTTYPSIIALADHIYSYADQASGGDDLDASYYKFIFDSIHELAELKENNPTSKKIKELTDAIKAAIDAMVKQIKNLQVAAKQAVTDLKAFEEECKKDHSALETRVKLVKEQITDAGGDIERLQKQMKTDQKDLADDEKELAHDKLIMYTSASYAWCTVVGAISALTVDIVYAIKLANMQKTIDALNNKIKSETKELEDDKAIVTELTNVNMDIQSVLDLIGPAVTAIEKMIGVWDAIAHDLETIQKFVDTDIRTVSAALTPLVSKSIVHKWADLKKAVDAYRKVAYQSGMPNVTTLEEYAKELAKKLGPP